MKDTMEFDLSMKGVKQAAEVTGQLLQGSTIIGTVLINGVREGALVQLHTGRKVRIQFGKMYTLNSIVAISQT